MVEITETIPGSWDYWLGWTEECVTITEGEDSWSASVDLDACGGSTSIWYDLYLPDPFAGPPAAPGTYTIQGSFNDLGLDSAIVVCAQVNVEDAIYFYGYGWGDLWMADPNGDDLTSYDWDFGEFGTASGQEPSGGFCGAEGWPGECYFTFEDLSCEYDPEWGNWVWSYDLDVTLTVTDEPGDSTTVETTIPLGGFCGGGEWIAEILKIGG